MTFCCAACAGNDDSLHRVGAYLWQQSPDGIAIDATFNGNIARYVNHSCAANCVPVVSDDSSELYRIGFFSWGEIQIGEEITIDYRWDRDYIAESSTGLENADSESDQDSERNQSGRVFSWQSSETEESSEEEWVPENSTPQEDDEEDEPEQENDGESRLSNQQLNSTIDPKNEKNRDYFDRHAQEISSKRSINTNKIPATSIKFRLRSIHRQPVRKQSSLSSIMEEASNTNINEERSDQDSGDSFDDSSPQLGIKCLCGTQECRGWLLPPGFG